MLIDATRTPDEISPRDICTIAQGGASCLIIPKKIAIICRDAMRLGVRLRPSCRKLAHANDVAWSSKRLKNICFGLIASERFPSTLILNGTVAVSAYRLARYLFDLKIMRMMAQACSALLSHRANSLAVPSGDTVFSKWPLAGLSRSAEYRAGCR